MNSIQFQGFGEICVMSIIFLLIRKHINTPSQKKMQILQISIIQTVKSKYNLNSHFNFFFLLYDFSAADMGRYAGPPNDIRKENIDVFFSEVIVFFLIFHFF